MKLLQKVRSHNFPCPSLLHKALMLFEFLISYLPRSEREFAPQNLPLLSPARVLEVVGMHHPLNFQVYNELA